MQLQFYVFGDEPKQQEMRRYLDGPCANLIKIKEYNNNYNNRELYKYTFESESEQPLREIIDNVDLLCRND